MEFKRLKQLTILVATVVLMAAFGSALLRTLLVP